ncbi:N-6 DNA methylase [Xanthomonas sp. D-99]|uniref:HsdM family class I SAM-dependent methyltransferase n=1 Tax=Xanthomonas sp. D-99 TaxID=2821273 RepID=UPI001ADA0C69|nr:N-6 DNA methylase [Xanthomonas sp. D-99]MBO9879658.1 N-6 DNA methylase [Xanthomonas sp. D-99]
MTVAWDAVYRAAEVVCPEEPLRATNLLIAAASRHGAREGAKRWSGAAARSAIVDLALSPLPDFDGNGHDWQRVAELALSASYLGKAPEGMHSWAASYQRASSTQKSLGAYATHDAFAAALARITLEPLAEDRIHRIVDPSVGAGNLLLAAIEQRGRLRTKSHLKRFILSLHGVELDPRARELCCLLLWLAGADAGVSLQQVSENIRLDNALTRDWWSGQELYDVVLMNPPWESLRHSVGFAGDEERARTIARMSVCAQGAPGLPPLYSAQGKGDRNLFKAFVELAPHLLVEGGRLGAVLPAAFASDAGMAELRERYFRQFEIARWTGYENRAGYFPIDGRYKFGLLAATRSNAGTKRLSVRSFATEPSEVDAPHIPLRRSDIALIGGKYHVIPELSHKRELDVLRVALSSGAPLFEPGPLGRVRYRREVDLSLGRDRFQHVSKERLTRLRDGTFRNKKGVALAPLLEGRLVGAYDCAQKSWVSGSGRTAVWEDNGDRPLALCTPQYVMPVEMNALPRVAFCDVTASTNTRTMIASLVPEGWKCGNTAPVLEFPDTLSAYAGLGILNSMVFDWIARRMISGLHLNKFILEGLVWPRVSASQLELIAAAAWSICVHSPRGGLSSQEFRSPPWHATAKKLRPMDHIDAASTIEVTIAAALGLNSSHLNVIYDHASSDRRGFWRYIKANPQVRRVVDEVLLRAER